MNLFKKIIILVNLILCMLCINVFATTVEFDGKLYNKEESFHYVVDLSGLSETLKDYPYFFIYEKYANYYAIVFSENPLPVLHDGYKSSKYYLYYYVNCVGSYEAKFQMLSNPIDNHISIPDTPILIKENSNSNMDIFYFERESLSTGNINYNNNNGVPILYSNYDFIHADSGRVFFENNETPSWDDSAIDWESAFEYYVVPCNDLANIEHVGETYNKNLTLLTKANNLEGLLNNEELHNNNIYYWLRYDLDFVFTDSSGKQHTRTLHNLQAFDDKIYSFDLPYLISEMGDDEQYNLILASFAGWVEFWDRFSLAGSYVPDDSFLCTLGEKDVQAFWNDITEYFVDKYGYFDYDLILKPYVIKQITYPEYVEEVIYTYDTKSLIYDISNPDYISPSDSSKIDSPDGFEDIGIIVGPDGEKIGELDNSDDYDFDEDGNIVDGNGDVVATPEIDKDNNTIKWTGPNGENLGEHPFGDKLPTAEDQINGTLKDKNYDITGVIRGLKDDLQELLKGNNGLNKVFQWFKDVFNWLPFGLLEIFGILVSFFIIFKFIDIIRK